MQYAESEKAKFNRQSYLTLEQTKLLANSFVNIQFGYAPLICMFASKNSMLKVNKIHRRTLRVVYDDYNSTYEELLASHNDISIHQKHLKHLAIEVYKSLTNLNPEFMWPFFKNKPFPYNLRNRNISILLPARSSHYDLNSVQFQGSLIWNNLPLSVKESVSVKEFKQIESRTKDSLSIMSILVFVKFVFISLVVLSDQP